MSNQIIFHTMYDPLVPAAEPGEGDFSLFSLKWERYATGGFPPIDFVDIVALSGSRIVAVPFVRVTDAKIVFPQAARGLGEPVLLALQSAVRTWWTQKSASLPPSVDVFSKDPLLSDLLIEEHPGNAIVPGIVLHAQLMAAVEPYRHVAAHCSNKHVFDLNPGSGYPASIVRRFAASYRCHTATERDRVLRERLGQSAPSISEHSERADVVLALGLLPQDVAGIADRGRGHLAPGGRMYLSSRGPNALEALSGLGTPTRLTALGGEATASFDEYMLAVEPASKVYGVPDSSFSSNITVAAQRLSVLFVLRNTAHEVFGGDVVQVNETAAALRARGHRVDITTDASPPTNGYDVVELSNLTAGPITLEQAKAVEDFDGPVVMMPIFTDHADETTWGMHASVVPFMMAEDSGQLEEWLLRLANREFSVNGVLPPPARSDHYSGSTAQQRQMLERVDFLVANALSEVHRIYRFLSPGIPFAIVPSCANPSVYGMHTRQHFLDRYDLADFVLVTGRFEPRKNQLLLFEVARRRPERTFVCIGKNYEEQFGDLVRRYWPRNVLILPQMPEADLAGAYAAARVAALPAWDEVVSLSSLNAAISGPSLVLTRNSYEHEYVLDDAEYCDPGDYRSIGAAIDRAWDQYDARVERRNALAARVSREFNWNKAAELTEAVFCRLLSDNPRGADRLRRFSSARL